MIRRIELRIPWRLGDLLKETVYRAGAQEYVAIGLVSAAKISGRDVLLLRHVLPLNDEDYIANPNHGASWKGSAMLPALAQAMDEGLGVFIFHAHCHEGLPKLSGDDLNSAGRLLPMFKKRVPGRPHGSVVLSRTHAHGLIQMPGEEPKQVPLSVRWVGSSILNWPETQEVRDGEVSFSEFERQIPVIGSRGQELIRTTKIVVVGLGGGGSIIVQQLAHLGFGTIVGVDPDRTEGTNRHRLVGVSWWDILLKRKKVEIASRMVKRIGMGAKFIKIPHPLSHPLAIEEIKSADLIIGCLDNLHARADLQELASRFLIPYIDIGVSIRQSSEAGAIIGGNVITYIPGGFCLWCCGFISKEKLGLELDGPNRNYLKNRPGQPQVINFNGVVASQAVSEALQLVTGFSARSLLNRDLRLGDDPDLQRGFKKLDGALGTVEEWGAKRKMDCPHCHSILAQGDLVWL